MAEATFTIRAIDATRQAFASVQTSLSRIGKYTRDLANVTKAAFGATALIKGMEMIDRKLTKIGESGEDVGFSDEQIASAIRMQQAVEGMVNFFTMLPIIAARFGYEIKESLIGPSETIEETIRKFRTNAAKTRMEGLDKDIASLRANLEDMGKPAGDVADSLMEGANALRAQAQKMEVMNPVGALELEKRAIEQVIEARRMQFDITQRLKESQKDVSEAQKSMGLSGGVALTLDESKARALSLSQQLTEIEETMKRLRAEDKPFGFAQEEYITKAKEYSDIVKQIVKIEEERGQLARDASDMIAMGFEDAIFSGQKLSDVIRQLALDLMRLLFNRMVTQQLAGGIMTLFGFPGRANGGPVTGRSPYVVGERGPELFVPGTSGAIIPNHKMGAAGGGGGPTVNISYNIQSGVSRAELQPILEQERKRLRAEIPDMVRRGGSYRAAFA
jgi:hypothetical protein